MMQEATTLNGERAALVRAGAFAAALPSEPPEWLIDLKSTAIEMRQRRERPPGRPFGRWLGDFLDQDSYSGLLPAEEKLLFAAAHGEPCVLEGRAASLWAAFEAWRETGPQAPEGDLSFVEAIAKFTEAAPEPIQDIIIEATRHAIEELRLPAYWEPQSAGDVEEFALSQRRFLARLEAEARPSQTIESARRDESFYRLAVEAVIESLTPKPYEPLSLQQDWLNPLLVRDPLNLSNGTRARIEAEPRVLQGFFEALAREARRPGQSPDLARLLKADPGALRETFDAVFARYEREHWRKLDPEDPEIQVRARFLRFLALGGDDFAPVHESRLELHGAHVEGDLDLSGCTVAQPLAFVRCRLSGRLILQGAVAKSLDLSTSSVRSIEAGNCRVQGAVSLTRGFFAENGAAFPFANIAGDWSAEGGAFLSGERCAIGCEGVHVTGSVNLGNGFLGEGGVFFNGAKIEGGVNGAGGAFHNRARDGKGVALSCDAARIGGAVALGGGFQSQGAVSFRAASMKGALTCAGGRFVNQTEDGTGVALDASGADIGGPVLLRDGFSAEGEVRFSNARLKNDLCCAGASFANLARSQADASFAASRAATAINFKDAKIEGALWLSPPEGGTGEKTDIRGCVNLVGCEARAIAAEAGSWPRRKVDIGGRKSASAFILLDGFIYHRMAGLRDHDPAVQMRWLDRQPPEHLGVDFRPQPFDQLIQAYREMGLNDSARAIAKFKERRRYGAQFAKLWRGLLDRPEIGAWPLPPPLTFLAWPLAVLARAVYRAAASIVLAAMWAFVAFGTAYWHGWGRLAIFLIVLWGMGGVFYREVALQGGFAPANPVIYLNKDLSAKCGPNWTECAGAPPELPGFSPFAYSLDLMLPAPDLGQKQEWQPADRPGKPVIFVVPKLVWRPAFNPDGAFPDIIIKERPLPEGAVDKIAKAQTLLSWGVFGLLIAMLFKKAHARFEIRRRKV